MGSSQAVLAPYFCLDREMLAKIDQKKVPFALVWPAKTRYSLLLTMLVMHQFIRSYRSIPGCNLQNGQPLRTSCREISLLLAFLIYKIFFSATKVYIDDVLTCRAWKRDSVAKKKRLSS